MIKVERKYMSRSLVIEGCKMGKDVNISIHGGRVSHVGGVVMGIMSPALHEPERLTYTEQVVSLQGHKDVKLARPVARLLAKQLKCTVVVVCGIHYPDITMKDIIEIEKQVMAMAAEICGKLSAALP